MKLSQKSSRMIVPAFVIAVLLVGGFIGARYMQSADAPDAGTSPDVVAVVNGHQITMAYVNEQIGKLPLGQQTVLLSNLDRFIESIVQEETLFQFALTQRFEHVSEDQLSQDATLRDAMKSQIVNELIEQQVTQAAQVTDDQIRKYYDDNRSSIREEHVGASQILLAQRSACEAMMNDIASDEDFAKKAVAHSLDEASAKANGHIGLFMNHGGALGFEEQLFTMTVGEMRIFDGDRGCHLVRLTSHVVPPLPPLEEVTERIRELLSGRNQSTKLAELLSRSAQTVSVERFPATR